MKTGIDLPLGEKLKQIRNARKLTQEQVGAFVKYTGSNISFIESGRITCDPEILPTIRKFLKVDKMPLFESERPSFKYELSKLYNHTSEREFEAANEIKKKLADIIYLPFDQELIALYELFICRLLLGEKKDEEAKAILNKYAPIEDEFTDELKYYYYNILGTLRFRVADYKEALAFYLKSQKLIKDDYDGIEPVYLNISTCLSRLGYTVSSVMFLEDIEKISKGRANFTGLHRDHKLAIEYINLGHLRRAKDLLDKCYINVKKVIDEKTSNNLTDYKIMYGAILHNYGCLYFKAADWNMAIKYLDQALDYFERKSVYYLDVLCTKILCLIEMECPSKCRGLVAEGRELSQGNKYYTIMLESLEHLTTPNDIKSINYIETITLPYFLEIQDNISALYYCEFLRKQFEKKELSTKALQMSEIARTIYKDKVEGGVFL